MLYYNYYIVLINELLCLDTVLIFGCRGQNTDYFYKEEWEKYESMNLLKVITAFSRDQV